jgi:predicted ATPase
MSLADRLLHPFTTEVTLEYAAHVHLHRREPEIGLAYMLALEKLRVEQRVSFVIEPGFLRGAAQLEQGAVDDAAATFRETFVPGRLGALAWQPYGRAIFADALTRQGAYAQAAACLREALDHVEATGERVWEAELHRINGRVLLAENDLDGAQESLRQAIRVAHVQQAKSLELRAATDLARLWGEQGRRSEAYELHAAVYGWFTEGFDTADLKEAKALLDELT